ncbi:hypothetical protein J6590_043308 [Homalodisca vitripennis]|nr:hypothetical protein J6590_043308 [Homalodisca vitripennis]
MANDRFILDARNRPHAMWEVVNRETNKLKLKTDEDLEPLLPIGYTGQPVFGSDISATRLGRPDWRLKPLWGCKYACGRRESECATTTNWDARRGFVQCAMLRNHILLVRTAPAFNVQVAYC